MEKPAASKPKKRSVVDKFKRDQEIGARQALLEEIFNDMYRNKHAIYMMNFVRGIFFGFGSVIGGTVVVALIVWALSFFVNLPWIGETVQNTQQKIEQGQHR